MRPRCSVFIATSLDGFVARADGRLDWLSVVERPGEDYGYAGFFASVDTLVVGRATYDHVLGFGAWPWSGKRVLVLTHRPPPAPRADERFVEGAPVAIVEQLEREGAKRLYVDGGNVIRQFLAAGLVDDLVISTIPVLLGAGLPLFGGGVPETRLELVRSASFPSGLVQSEWRVVR